MTDENNDRLAQAAWTFIPATAFDNCAEDFNMGTPAHWAFLRTHDDGGSE